MPHLAFAWDLQDLDSKKEKRRSLKSQRGGRVQRKRKRKILKHKPFYWNPFSRGVPFNSTAKEVILLRERSLMCCKSWESRRSIVATVTSLQDPNISPRSQCVISKNGCGKPDWTREQRQAGRPKPEQVCERYKSKAAAGVWRFWDRVQVMLFLEGVAAGLTKGNTSNSVLYAVWTKKGTITACSKKLRCKYVVD